MWGGVAKLGYIKSGDPFFSLVHLPNNMEVRATSHHTERSPPPIWPPTRPSEVSSAWEHTGAVVSPRLIFSMIPSTPPFFTER